jgi:acetyltransferase-like isoleucine patch superfamily enzyme
MPAAVLAFVSIGGGVTVGPDCRIGSYASRSHALLGAGVYLYPGARVAQAGFSFATAKTGFLSIPQLGRVIVEDDVEVGVNTTIDRGSTQDTMIGAGARIDDLVQIGHDVRLGRRCVIAAQVGIAGSTVLEDFIPVGGQATIRGLLRVGQGSGIGAWAGVVSDVPTGSILLGSPARPRKEFYRQVTTWKRMSRRPGWRGLAEDLDRSDEFIPALLCNGWWAVHASALTSLFNAHGDGKADDGGDADGRSGGNRPRNKTAGQQFIPRRYSRRLAHRWDRTG